MEWAQSYLGSRGLATKYLVEEMNPRADPLSPENVLIFATGPLTGTTAPTGGRYTVVTKGALTNAVACSNSGGYFGGELKLAGWDMVICTGRSPRPVYLYIKDEHAELIDAEGFVWGKSVWDTEPAIKARHQDSAIKIASIGRAGENLNRYACVMNDLDRAAGRSGVGAVMGSKNLKAIAVRGTRGVAVDDTEAFADAVEKAAGALAASQTRADLARTGTLSMIDVTQAFGSLPTRNNQDVQFEGTGNLGPDAMATVRRSDGSANLVKNRACFACTIGCQRASKMDPNHFAVSGEGRERYRSVSGGLEYESAYSLGPMVGVDDIEAATFANFRLQRGRDGPDLLWGHGRRCDGALRKRASLPMPRPAASPTPSARRKRSAGRPRTPARARASARTWGSAPSVSVRSTAAPNWPWSPRGRSSPAMTAARCRAWALPTPPATAAPATCGPTLTRMTSPAVSWRARPRS